MLYSDLSPEGGDAPLQGMVFRKSQGEYAVVADGRTVTCAISNKLRKRLLYPIADPASLPRRVVRVADIGAVDPVAVGDEVLFLPAGDGSGMIVEVLPRRSRLVRRAAGPKPLEQVIVANVDQVVAVTAAHPDPSWELLDRYLAAAEAAELPARVVVTKTDLVDPGSMADEVADFRRIGYPVLLASPPTGQGVENVRTLLHGRISVLAGRSGVGKTTLLNAVQPGLGLRVAAVSAATGKGRHTTSQLEMFGLNGGGAVVDTPGMRELGLWYVPGDELPLLFPEVRPFVGQCRFGLGCGHVREPGCAIKRAVERGEVSERRYRSLLRMAD